MHNAGNDGSNRRLPRLGFGATIALMAMAAGCQTDSGQRTIAPLEPSGKPMIVLAAAAGQEIGVAEWQVYRQDEVLTVFGIGRDGRTTTVMTIGQYIDEDSVFVESELVYPETASRKLQVDLATSERISQEETAGDRLDHYGVPFAEDARDHDIPFKEQGSCLWVYVGSGIGCIFGGLAGCAVGAAACLHEQCDGCGCSCAWGDNCSNC